TDNIIGIPIGGVMDWQNPLRSIATTVDADVLRVLEGTHASVTGNQLARLAGRSYAQVSSVVRRLVTEGIVSVEQHGRTYSYRLNRDHALATGVGDLLAAPGRIEKEITEFVEAWEPPPDAVALFGSAARREATPESDVDLLVVRSDEVDPDDAPWRARLGELVRMIERRSGNRVQLLEIDRRALAEAVETNQPLIESLRSDARTLFGEDLRRRLATGTWL
ncbi:MAG: nucleotidyltransferase domain-containing protein, partial [Acidimicrobiia bacterium]